MPRWPGTSEERFWRRVRRTRGCWFWQGKPNPGSGGYGVFTYRGKQHLAHRVAWALTHRGSMPALNVLHKCDVPLCVRPGHLFLGTQRDNVQDMVKKGRHPRTRTPKKLTVREVQEIRMLKGQRSYVDIANTYGISESLVYAVWSRQVWAWVPKAPEEVWGL